MNQELKDKRINDLIALFTKGQIDKCISQGKKVLNMYPNEPFLFNILGITHAAKGLFSESLHYYEKAIDLNPSYFEVFNNMGVAYNDWKKPKEAILCLKKAIAIQPSYAEAFNNIGNSYKELSDFDNAIISYKKAIDLAPNYTDALCNLGICWSLQEKYEQAESAYKKALEIDPGQLKIRYYLGDLYFGMGQYIMVRNCLLKFVDSSCMDPDINNLIGKSHQKEGSIKALHYYRKALALKNKNGETLNNIGSFLYEKRKLNFAVRYFKKSIDVDAQNMNPK